MTTTLNEDPRGDDGAAPSGPEELLQRAGRASSRAAMAILETVLCLREGDVVSASAAADDAGEAAQSTRLLLADAGIRIPDMQRSAVPVHLLDTPATRRLLDALRYAVECAQHVDEERGWTLPGGEGCGLVDAVGDLTERLRQEVEGPAGKETRR